MELAGPWRMRPIPKETTSNGSGHHPLNTCMNTGCGRKKRKDRGLCRGPPIGQPPANPRRSMAWQEERSVWLRLMWGLGSLAGGDRAAAGDSTFWCPSVASKALSLRQVAEAVSPTCGNT